MTIRVFLVDDQAMVRAGFAMVVASQDDMTVVGEAGDGAEALARLALTPADIVLMDVRMPRMDGVEATRQLLARPGPTPRVIVLTTFDLDEYAFAALRAGASGFLLKDAPPEDLLSAIRTVHQGDAVIAPSTTRRLLDHIAANLPAPSNGPDPLAALTARSQTAAPVIAGLGLVAALVALIMTRTRVRGLSRVLLLTFAWALTVALLILIPDRRVLIAIAYAPLFLIGAPFHWPPVSFLLAIPWPVVNQFILIVGGILWAATAVAYQRRSHDTCEYCGRIAAHSEQQLPRVWAMRWARSAKWAVAVAITVPIIYAASRYAWLLGIPLGITQQFLREGQRTGLWWAGAGLATIAVTGAILTLGLVQRWGEVFPRWMIGLAGKRVPPALAIVPATLVSIILTSSGLAEVRTGLLVLLSPSAFPIELTWATLGPTLLWPIWGVALGFATYAYYLRRRGQCQHCGLR